MSKINDLGSPDGLRTEIRLPPMPGPTAWTEPCELRWVTEEQGFGQMCHASLRDGDDLPLFTREQLREYGAACARAMQEVAARIASDADKATHPADLADAILALSAGRDGGGA